MTALIAQTWLAGAVLLAVMVASALASTLGRRVAGRSAAAASTSRARFGQSLVSALESVRTVKLAAATPQVHAHLRQVDGGRVDAAVREHRVQALLDGVPIVMVQCGVVAAWGGLLAGEWGLATALLVANAVSGFDWFGRVAGSVVTEAPGTRAWMNATSRLAGGGDLMDLPPGMDTLGGTAAAPAPAERDPLHTLTLRGLSAVHDDGTLGVQDVDLEVSAGELVLLLGQVGSGKSSLLGALAGLVSITGELRWNGRPVDDPQTTMRPGRVAHVAQVPRVLSGTFSDNVALDHEDRAVLPALEAARMGRDVAEAGGPDAMVGHRGVRLSGGQVQRLALARALACDADVLLADDISSALDATTEIELWQALRERGRTVIGATSKALPSCRPIGSSSSMPAGSSTTARGPSSPAGGHTSPGDLPARPRRRFTRRSARARPTAPPTSRRARRRRNTGRVLLLVVDVHVGGERRRPGAPDEVRGRVVVAHDDHRHGRVERRPPVPPSVVPAEDRRARRRTTRTRRPRRSCR